MSGPAANRLLAAARLYRETGLPIIFSGGQVFADSGNEADIARRQLIGLGIPAEDILPESRSLNTEQNAVNTAKLMQEHGLSRPVLVTSGFHMPRSMVQFEHAGLKPQAFSGRFPSQPSHVTLCKQIHSVRRSRLHNRAGAEGVSGVNSREAAALAHAADCTRPHAHQRKRGSLNR
ncbi:YdcF family protein [Paenibacillus rhizoplanae]